MDLKIIVSLGFLLLIAVKAHDIDKLDSTLRGIYRAPELYANGTVVLLVGSTGNGSFSQYLLGRSQRISCASQEPRTLSSKALVHEATGARVVDLAHFQDASPESAAQSAFLIKELMDAGREFKIVIVEKKHRHFEGNLFQSLVVAANLIGTDLQPFAGSVGLVLTGCRTKEVLEFETLDHTKRLEKLHQGLKAAEEESEKSANWSRKAPLRVAPLLRFLINQKKVRLFDWKKTREFIHDTLKPSKPSLHRPLLTTLYGWESSVHPQLLKWTMTTLENEFEKLRAPLLKPLDDATGASVQPLQKKISSVITFCKDHLRLLGRIRTVEQLAMLARKNGMADITEIYFQKAKLRYLVGFHSNTLVNTYLERFMISLVEHVTGQQDAYSQLLSMISVAGSYEAQSFFWNDLTGLKPHWIHQTHALAQKVARADGEAFKSLVNELWYSNNMIKIKGATVTFSGRFLVLSTLKEVIEAVVGEVILIATDTIFVDCNLSLEYANLRLVAPKIEVVSLGKLEFQIQSQDKSLSCVRGKGTSSFSLVALDVQNGDHLSVSTPVGVSQDECDRFDWGNLRSETATLNQQIIQKFHENYKCKWLCTSIYSQQRRLLLNKIISNQSPKSNGNEVPSKAHSSLVLEKSVGRDYTLIHTQTALGTKKMNVCPYKQFSHLFDSRSLILVGGLQHGGSLTLTDIKSLSSHDAGAQSPLKEGALLEQAFDFYEVITRENIIIQLNPATGKLLRLLLTSNQVVQRFTDRDFTAMMEFAEVNVATTTQDQKTCSIQSLHFLYTSMLDGVTTWRLSHSEGGSASVTEYALLSLLETLEALMHGKQVVRLAALVDTQLLRLGDVDKAIESVGKFESIAGEKQFFMDKIAAAEKLIASVQKQQLAEKKKQSEEEFGNLLAKTDQMKTVYKETDQRLVQHKKKLEQNMWKNIGLGILNSLSMVAAVFFPPAAAIGPVVSGVVNAAVPKPGELSYESKVAKAVQNSKEVFRHFEAQKEAKQNNLVAAVQRILEKDNGHSFLEEESRLKLENVIKQAEGGIDINDLDVESLFNGVETVLSESEKKLELLGEDDSGKREALDSVKGSVEVARHAAGAAVAASKTVVQFLNDRSKIEEVDVAINQNRQNLNDLMEYERDVERTFKPMVSDMVETFESMGVGLKSQEEFERLFQKLDLKTHVRKCISMVQKLTQDFFEKDEGFVVVLTELQELLTVLMEAFDKIEELRYRSRLVSFIGRMSGTTCVNKPDPAACNALQKMAAAVKTNELVRDLALVLAAYRQTSFPFGAAKMRALSATRLQLVEASRLALRSAPRDQIVGLLRSALETIRDDLARSSHVTENQNDASLMKGIFASGMESSYPFYVWPGEHFPVQISQLLGGKEVILEASASHPDVLNAAKFTWVALQFNSTDPEVSKRVNGLLKKFRLEMTRGAESYFRCGTAVYAMDGAELNMTMSFERDAKGDEVAQNKVRQKVTEGDVPLSPYALWRFRLVHASRSNPKPVFSELQQLASKVNLELVGEGFFVQEGAEICNADLSGAYDRVGHVANFQPGV